MDTFASPSAAYLLVTHGSRDPRPAVAAQTLARRVCGQLSPKFGLPPLVETAALELQRLPLHRQIQALVDRAVRRQIRTIRVVPLFLLPGVHVMEDIPAEVELAARHLDRHRYNLEISIQPYLGSHSGTIELLAQDAATFKAPEAKIVLSHGSRRPGGNQPIEEITEKLHRRCQIPVVAAYWSVAPSLEQRVRELVAAGYYRIEVLPYFLFPGRIVDAIGKQVAQLENQFPQTALHFAQPLGVSNRLAAIVTDLADRQLVGCHRK